MSKYNDAALVIKRAAVKYEQMVAVAAVLDEVGSLEQAATEARAAYAAAQKDADTAKSDLTKAKAKIKDAEAKAEAIVAAAGEQAVQAAAVITKDAEVSAAEILKKAQDEGAALIAQAATEKARMSSEIGGLQKSIIDAQTELASLLTAREAAIKSAADADAKLDSIRGKLKQLAGI